MDSRIMKHTIGRTIPAFIVQSWLQQIIDSDDDTMPYKVIEAAEDMGLLKVCEYDADNRACDIEWLRVD